MYKSKNITQAAILVGGLGSRLRKVTKNTPKPLVKFNFKPFINYLIEYYEANGFTEILLLCSYKYTLFKKKYHNKKFRNIKIKCIEQKIPNGNLRALKIAYKFLKQDFLLCNGDTFININLEKIKNYYFSKKKIKSLAILTNHNKNKSKRYTFFSLNKKTKKIEINKNLNFSNTGIYIFNKNFLKKFLNTDKSSIEKDLIPNIIQKKNLYGSLTKKQFIDIGTPEDFFKTEIFLEKNFPRPCAFLDRDGVINKDLGYVHRVKDFVWMPKIREIIKYLNFIGYRIIVVSNQSGVGRSYYKEKDVKLIENHISRELNKKKVKIDAFYYAFYFKKSKNKKYRSNLSLRKPNNGFYFKAKSQFNIINKYSFMIGDQLSDKNFSKKSNLKFFYYKDTKNIVKKIKKFINYEFK